MTYQWRRKLKLHRAAEQEVVEHLPQVHQHTDMSASTNRLCDCRLLYLYSVVPRCTHSIPGYALELYSLPMSSSLLVLFSLPGLSFIFPCLLACIAEGTYAGLYSWVPMVHGPRVLIRRICVNYYNNNICISVQTLIHQIPLILFKNISMVNGWCHDTSVHTNVFKSISHAP